ncbi:hypothetical protein SAICODRAFT_30744, partial [Saitoella complicata NRRL Y-17804]
MARQRIAPAVSSPVAAPRTFTLPTPPAREPVLQPPPESFMMEQYLEARRKLLQVEKELESANQKLVETHNQQGVKRKREDDEEEVPVPRAVEVAPVVDNDAMVIDDEPTEEQEEKQGPAKKKARFGYVASALGGVVLGGVAMFAGLVASAAG